MRAACSSENGVFSWSSEASLPRIVHIADIPQVTIYMYVYSLARALLNEFTLYLAMNFDRVRTFTCTEWIVGGKPNPTSQLSLEDIVSSKQKACYFTGLFSVFIKIVGLSTHRPGADHAHAVMRETSYRLLVLLYGLTLARAGFLYKQEPIVRFSPALGDSDLFGYAVAFHRVDDSGRENDFYHAISNTV